MNIFGITIQIYGLIVGVAILLAICLIEERAKKLGWDLKELQKVYVVALIFGIFGARIWHVMTDFYLYENELLNIFKIWQGGLSILGAVLGGVAGIYLALRVGWLKNKRLFLEYLDLAVFGLPFGQALGRLANYFNEELYGLPTSMPWGIFIKSENRPDFFSDYTHFHPLFLYEAILLLGFGGWLWWKAQKVTNKIIPGNYFLYYLIFYSSVRFMLDFLRWDKTTIAGTGLGINQLVLLIVVSASIFCWIYLKRNYDKKP